MIVNRMRHCRFLPFAAVVTALIAGCTGGDRLAGGSGSTTTNGFTTAVRDGQGRAVAGAVVRVRSSDYCATGAVPSGVPAERSVVDTLAGSDGTVSIGGLRPGSYTIEIQNGASGEGLVIKGDIDSGPVVDFGVRTTKPVGAVCGLVDSTLLVGGATFCVQVYGMERRAPVDPATGGFLVEGLPPEKYALRLIADDTAFSPVNFDTLIVASGDTVRVDPFELWAHQATLTVDLSSARLSSADTLINFPLLLRLTRDNFDFSTAKKKGGDFRAARSGGAPAPIEQDWWDSTNATAAIWILVDTIFGGRPAQTMNIFWGNGKILSVSRPNDVFDTLSGFCGVWHLNESGGTLQKDATAHRRDGTPNGMDGSNDIPGIIGRAQRFDGDSTRIEFAAAGSASPGSIMGMTTISAWVKVMSAAAPTQSIVASIAPGFGIMFNNGRWVVPTTTSDATTSLSGTSAAGSWTFLTAVQRGATRYFYVNGAAVDSAIVNALADKPAGTGSGFIIGCGSDYSGPLTGIVDELRVYDHPVSDAWIRLCSETQREGQLVVSISHVR